MANTMRVNYILSYLIIGIALMAGYRSGAHADELPCNSLCRAWMSFGGTAPSATVPEPLPPTGALALPQGSDPAIAIGDTKTSRSALARVPVHATRTAKHDGVTRMLVPAAPHPSASRAIAPTKGFDGTAGTNMRQASMAGDIETRPAWEQAALRIFESPDHLSKPIRPGKSDRRRHSDMSPQ